jgi:hypothetical protein
LAVGGAVCSSSVFTVTMFSTAPAAPSRWPIIDFVLETTVLYAASPSPTFVAAVSAGSFFAVPVPWLFT